MCYMTVQLLVYIVFVVPESVIVILQFVVRVAKFEVLHLVNLLLHFHKFVFVV